MPKGLFGRRYISQHPIIAQLMDPFGHDRTPNENPNSVSMGAPAFSLHNYTPPTYGAARDAIARARSMHGEPVLDPNSNSTWYAQRQELDRLREQAAADRAEQAHRERVSFDQFWRFGGRQSPEWQYGRDPFYRAPLPQQRRPQRR